MSNIATNSIVGKVFNPIVTNISYDELNQMRMEEVSINIPNCMLFSIPTTDPNSGKLEDIPNEGSIWLTDANGYLYCMTKPINKYLEFESLTSIINPISNINGDKKVASIKWYGNLKRYSIQYENPSLTGINALIVKYEDESEDILNVNTISNFTLSITNEDGKSVNSFWYNSIGKYYIKGTLLGYNTVSNNKIETDNVLEWNITENTSNTPDNPTPTGDNPTPTPDNPTPTGDNPTIPDNPSTNKYYWYIGAENPSSVSNIQTDDTTAGWHEINSLSGFSLNFSRIHAIEFDVQTQYYVIIPSSLCIYAADNSTIMEGKTFNIVNCNLSGYKAFQYKSVVWDVKGVIIK